MATQLISYSLQSGACLLLFYLFYRLLLRSQPSLWFNRAYLLLAPVAAMALPLLGRELNFVPASELPPALQVIQLPEVVVSANAPAADGFATIMVNTGIPELLLGFYAIVAAVLLARLCQQVLIIRQMADDAEPLPYEAPQVQVLQSGEDHATFAFLNYVFLNHPPQLTAQERRQVLDHEVAHVQLRHTLDVLFYEVMVLLFWLNPAIWLLRAELLDVHEYQADAHTIRKHEPKQYGTLLAKSVLFAHGIFMGSSFSRHQVFRRLQMLQHAGEESSVLRKMLVVPLLGILVFFLSAQRLAGEQHTDVSYASSNTDAVYYNVIPSYAGTPEPEVTRKKASPSAPDMIISWNREEAPATGGAKSAALAAIKSGSTATSLSAPNKQYSSTSLPALGSDYVAVIRRAYQSAARQAPPEKEVKTPAPAVEAEEKPYTFADQMPSFIGGEKALFSFIAKNLKYPREAINSGTEGQVFVAFVVQKDGSIQDVEILRGLGAATDEEAVRVIQSMDGLWEPGRHNGLPVPVKYNIPIKFKLN